MTTYLNELARLEVARDVHLCTITLIAALLAAALLLADTPLMGRARRWLPSLLGVYMLAGFVWLFIRGLYA